MATVPESVDAVIVGGGYAGLAAALYLGRARRSVVVVDAGEPRNRFVTASQGFLGRDGADPSAILADARRQIALYATVQFVGGRVSRVERAEERFLAHLESGAVLRSRRVVLATGVVDLLPDLPGLRERWGATVLHCPYCHGFEFADRRLGVLALGPRSVEQAQLVAEWGPVIFFANGLAVDEGAVAALAARGIAVEPGLVAALDGTAPELAGVRLADGRLVAVDALYIGAPTRLADPIAERLGCAIDEGHQGPVIRVDGNQQTTVPGVYAAGDAARARHSVSWAVADGVTAGVSVHQSLVFSARD